MLCHMHDFALLQVGMLALEALFVLVTRHGLDYPDLYPSLYAMLTPQIFLVNCTPQDPLSFASSVCFRVLALLAHLMPNYCDSWT